MRIGMKFRRVGTTLGAALIALLLGSGCTVERVNESEIGIVYTQGPIEGEKFHSVVPPGGSQTVVDDLVYKLPARQITYHIGSQDTDATKPCGECDRTAIRFTAKGGVDMLIEMTTLSFLNYREAAIKPFFNEICKKFDCWDDKGWVQALNYSFGKPLEDLIKDVGLTYDPEKLRYDAETKDAFAVKVARDFVDYQKKYTGRGDIFCGQGYEYGEKDRKADGWCPNVATSITDIKFADPNRESVHEREQLSKAEEKLAVQELATAKAQQAVNAAKATPENLELIKAEAMKKCAENPGGCNLTVIIGAEPGQVTVPVR